MASQKNRGGGDRWLSGHQRVLCGIFVCVQICLFAGFVHVAHKRAGQSVTKEKKVKKVSDARKPTAVSALSELTMEPFVQAFPNGTLVNFHRATCKYCTALAPEFEAAAKHIQGLDGPPLASIEGDLAPRIMEMYGIEKFPTVLWFRNGQVVQEVPPTVRTASTLVEWVDTNSQPAVVELDSVEDLEGALGDVRGTLRTDSAPVVVAIFSPQTEASVYDDFEMAAEKNRGRTVFIYINSDVETTVVKTIYDEEERDEVLEAPFGEGQLETWISERVKRKSQVTAGSS